MMSNIGKNTKENTYLVFIFSIMAVGLIGLLYSISITKTIICMYPNMEEVIQSFRNIILVVISIIMALSVWLVYSIRGMVIDFTSRISGLIDDMIDNKVVEFDTVNETVTSKIESKLKTLFEMLEVKNKANKEEKEAIQSLIGDIAHQVNTPIANISMYNQILIDRDVDSKKQKEFLTLVKKQVEKLEWLIQSLLKMSRLETGTISINLSEGKVFDVIATSLSGIYLKASKKHIEIKVDCDESLDVKLDKKWTTEALFNVIDNAVKYSKENSTININVEKWQMFTKIDVIDEGIGISEEEINNIFKRFYRSEEVSEIEGVGVGLFLVREIITKQGGFIKVKSTKGKGSCFSIFLAN